MQSTAAERVAADLATFAEQGYAVIENALAPHQLDAVLEGLEPLLRDAPLGRNDFEGMRSNRVYALLAKVPAMAALVEHPHVLAMLDALLEPRYLLTAALAINLLPGETEQSWHFDDGFYTLPRPRPPVSISTIWALDGFTAGNGATEVIPGSHRWGSELPDGDDARRVLVTMPAGSVVVFSGTLWHRGGANRSDSRRLCVSPQYCQPWGRQQENMMLAVGRRAAEYSPRLREMLGYSIHPPFMGMVDGMHPSRLIEDGYDPSSTGARGRADSFWDGDRPRRGQNP
ncbi:MAG TPA: phytanoyl-CoA dioxygenase family protein [Candidatus Dormibacteraeota bacterium]|nr:phytanoyl-CoA dioxygenase family protein [Candidatus Dormibacteraeota bacterium]